MENVQGYLREIVRALVDQIVRSMFATGVVDHPAVRRVVDPFKGRDDARKIEEESLGC